MNEDPMLKVWLMEYDKLKVEQIQRIGFRDNLLYTTLGIFGAVVSFAMSNPANTYALLVVPWVCLVLGWTYVVNDEKISAIASCQNHRNRSPLFHRVQLRLVFGL